MYIYINNAYFFIVIDINKILPKQYQMLSKCYDLSNRLWLHAFYIDDMTSIKVLDYINQRGMY